MEMKTRTAEERISKVKMKVLMMKRKVKLVKERTRSLKLELSEHLPTLKKDPSLIGKEPIEKNQEQISK